MNTTKPEIDESRKALIINLLAHIGELQASIASLTFGLAQQADQEEILMIERISLELICTFKGINLTAYQSNYIDFTKLKAKWNDIIRKVESQLEFLEKDFKDKKVEQKNKMN
jgi:hypothetical protein